MFLFLLLLLSFLRRLRRGSLLFFRKTRGNELGRLHGFKIEFPLRYVKTQKHVLRLHFSLELISHKIVKHLYRQAVMYLTKSGDSSMLTFVVGLILDQKYQDYEQQICICT